MVEEKKKRGRPKKIVAEKKEAVERSRQDVWDWEISGNQRRDDLVVGMIMAVLNKQGNIKLDYALDLFNTGTEMAYKFGWIEEQKQKKSIAVLVPQVGNNLGAPFDSSGETAQAPPLANTPADIWAAMHNK